MKLLFAEDDRDISRAVVTLLERSNYTVDPVYNGNDALDYLVGGDYDGSILDIMMPGKSGLQVVREAREQGVGIPVIMLTAMDEVDDRINGLDAGADDYLPKPFAGGELLARVRAMLRRRERYTPDLIAYGDLSLDRTGYRLLRGDQSVNLGNKGFQIMEMLMSAPGAVISVEQFMEHIWGWDTEVEVNVVWVHISQLRKTLGKLGSGVEIRVVRGAGYTLGEKRG